MELAKLVSAIVGGAIAIVIFTYQTFVTKDFLKEAVTDRLNRIESKLDKAIKD